MPYIFGKLWHLAIIWAIRKAFQCILQGVRFLLENQTWLSPTSDNDSYQELLRRVKKSQNQNPVRNQGLGLSCLLLCLIVMLVLCILGHVCSFSSIIEALLCGSTILWPPSKLKLFKFPLLFELWLQISLENFLFSNQVHHSSFYSLKDLSEKKPMEQQFSWRSVWFVMLQ